MNNNELETNNNEVSGATVSLSINKRIIGETLKMIQPIQFFYQNIIFYLNFLHLFQCLPLV